MIGVNVARGDNLAIGQVQQVLSIAGALQAHPDHAHIDAIVRRGCRALCRAIAAMNGRKKVRSSSTLQKASAVERRERGPTTRLFRHYSSLMITLYRDRR